MKFINKSLKNEPKSLKEIRSTPGSSFDDCDKNEIRTALLREQGYICAYCNDRIQPGYDNEGKALSKIEHFEPRTNKNEMNYFNLLGVCKGNEGKPSHLQHCDTRKGNTKISISPLKKNCEKTVKFDIGGNIYSNAIKIDRELNEILNLNVQFLLEARKIVINFAREEMIKKKKKGTWQKGDLVKEINRWKSKENGKYRKFCQVAIQYLEKKLARI